MNKGLFKLLYLFGVFITVIAAGIAIWPDFEARNFSQTFRGKDRASLSCPIAITANETSQVSLNLRNPLDRRARFAAISFLTSNGQATRPAEERQETYIEANDSGTLDWTIDASNTVYDYMVLARVYVFRSGSAPSQSGACGVWLFGGDWAGNSGLSGNVIYGLFAGVGLLTLGFGAVGASETPNPLTLFNHATGKPRFGVVLTGIVLLTLLLGILGSPMLGLGAITLGILLVFALIDRGPSESKYSGGL